MLVDFPAFPRTAQYGEQLWKFTQLHIESKRNVWCLFLNRKLCTIQWKISRSKIYYIVTLAEPPKRLKSRLLIRQFQTANCGKLNYIFKSRTKLVTGYIQSNKYTHTVILMQEVHERSGVWGTTRVVRSRRVFPAKITPDFAQMSSTSPWGNSLRYIHRQTSWTPKNLRWPSPFCRSTTSFAAGSQFHGHSKCIRLIWISKSRLCIKNIRRILFRQRKKYDWFESGLYNKQNFVFVNATYDYSFLSKTVIKSLNLSK